jgi:hypothetical protein
MRLLLPVILALLGAGAGIGAGIALKPPPAPEEDAIVVDPVAGAPAPESPSAEEGRPTGYAADPMPGRDRPPIEERDYVRMNNQFIVPVLDDGRVRSLVVLSLSLETRIGMRPTIYSREPKLRAAFLTVLFDHANAGGFDHDFTSSARIGTLRQALWEAGRPVLGADLIDVLVTDIARQDS